MSYDIGICLKAEDGGFELIDEPELCSPTYNLRDMFVACMDWGFELDAFYPAQYVFEKLNRGISELIFNREKYDQYNPPNGWGSIDSAIKSLKSARDCLEKNKEFYPSESLYFRWC